MTENIEKEKNTQLGIKSTINKEKCNTLLSQLPKRETTNLTSFKESIKNLTLTLTPLEKSYILFLWIGQNVDYDAQGYFAGTDVDVTPEGVFNNGKTVCSGYSRLYRDIGVYIDLIIENVSCYAKGVGYEPGDKFYSTNHEYNVIKLNDIWYPIDSTWGAGHIKDRQYVRESNEFYFCCDPELLIRTHFPSDEKWMLTENKYSLDDFSNWPHIYSYFYRLGFYKCFPDEAMIDIKSRGDNNFQKFIFWNNNMKNMNASCNVYLLKNNCYYQQLNLDFIFYYDDRFEVDCIFNKKGKYKITIYGNNKEKELQEGLIEYSVNVENDAQKELVTNYGTLTAAESTYESLIPYTVTIASDIENGTVKTDYTLPPGEAYPMSHCLMWFTDISEITADFLNDPAGTYEFGKPYSIRDDLGGKEIALLFICNRVTFRLPLSGNGAMPAHYRRGKAAVQKQLALFEELFARMN